MSSLARAARWELSGMATTRLIPTACNPSNTLLRMFTFSQSGTTLPWATKRRMSLLAAGFAIIPTSGKSSFSYPQFQTDAPQTKVRRTRLDLLGRLL